VLERRAIILVGKNNVEMKQQVKDDETGTKGLSSISCLFMAHNQLQQGKID
jgi:hypothetical protein